jgi:hypothetical protein
VDRLRSRKDGYTLDVDSTQLLHEEGRQKEGVAIGHTTRGQKRAYHPLLAIIAEAALVAGFWLRPGNTRCASNIIGFMEEVLARLPRWLSLKLVRADAGFCYEPLAGAVGATIPAVYRRGAVISAGAFTAFQNHPVAPD